MDFSDGSYFINRELSWLEFNQRVLDQAIDESNPLLERLKFLCIVSSNLDEFFEVRVAGLKQQQQMHSSETGPDGLTAGEALAAISQSRAADGRRPIRVLARSTATSARRTASPLSHVS